ncbi:MAG: alpha/beta hydrolase family protein, partial [Solimonas sp.]
GAQDTIAATLMAKARFPSVKTVYLLGVSLGGAVSGTALTESVHATADGKGLYDYWVALEPLSNVFEAYPEAAAALPEVAASLEEETGGTPLTQPQAYQRRSPALRTQEMAAAGLRAVAIVHGVNDGLVTYNQGRELALGLVASGIPVRLLTVLRHAEGQDPGTTGTGTLTGAAGIEDDPFTLLRLAGHADEADSTHPVMREGFILLQQMLDGSYDFTTPYSEGVIDDG